MPTINQLVRKSRKITKRKSKAVALARGFNSIKNKQGHPDPKLGTEAMMQALEVHRSRELADVSIEEHLSALVALAQRKRLRALREALRQRYPGFIGARYERR